MTGLSTGSRIALSFSVELERDVRQSAWFRDSSRGSPAVEEQPANNWTQRTLYKTPTGQWRDLGGPLVYDLSRTIDREGKLSVKRCRDESAQAAEWWPMVTDHPSSRTQHTRPHCGTGSRPFGLTASTCARARRVRLKGTYRRTPPTSSKRPIRDAPAPLPMSTTATTRS